MVWFLLAQLVLVQAGAEFAKITYSVRVQITQGSVAPNEGCNKSFDPKGSIKVVI